MPLYHTDPPKLQKNDIQYQTVFLNCYIIQVTLTLSMIFNVNLTVGLQYRSFPDYSKMCYLPYCSLIQGIYYIHHDQRLGHQLWHRQLRMATTVFLYRAKSEAFCKLLFFFVFIVEVANNLPSVTEFKRSLRQKLLNDCFI